MEMSPAREILANAGPVVLIPGATPVGCSRGAAGAATGLPDPRCRFACDTEARLSSSHGASTWRRVPSMVGSTRFVIAGEALARKPKREERGHGPRGSARKPGAVRLPPVPHRRSATAVRIPPVRHRPSPIAGYRRSATAGPNHAGPPGRMTACRRSPPGRMMAFPGGRHHRPGGRHHRPGGRHHRPGGRHHRPSSTATGRVDGTTARAARPPAGWTATGRVDGTSARVDGTARAARPPAVRSTTARPARTPGD
jgi:hypothetical protein